MVQRAREPVDVACGEVIGHGRSNITYRVESGAKAWVLRRPPLSHVLPTAHDMKREYRVISALEGTERARAGRDRAVRGHGRHRRAVLHHVVRRRHGAGRPGGVRGEVSDEAMRAAHRREPDRHAGASCTPSTRPRSGSATSASRRGSSRGRCGASRDRSSSTDEARLPGARGAGAAARERDPAGVGDFAIVHGDYRLDNCVHRRRRTHRRGARLGDGDASATRSPMSG